MTRSAFGLNRADDSGRCAPMITVSGEIDVTNAGEFGDSLAKLAATQPLILDLSPLRYLDSAGFAALEHLLSERTIALVISPQSPIHKAAEVMALPFFDDVDAASV
ncbi:MAG TPA: STAS domain-containing protein [Mycobacterium sp.]|nr:STAS domain-containing protein [Mycobacterium sp.]